MRPYFVLPMAWHRGDWLWLIVYGYCMGETKNLIDSRRERNLRLNTSTHHACFQHLQAPSPRASSTTYDLQKNILEGDR
eukprot:scaffold104970_cov32-Tisochrysis_lutea.AAC.1